ncbi:MAG TPA: NAD(P)H-hydrate epimerase [Gemmataceae bacterium]
MSAAPLVLSRSQVREVDRRAVEEYGMPGVVLMENAGRGCAEWLLALSGGSPGRVVICCGRGNNGGDGFVIARHLDNRGVPVQIFLFANPDELAGDAAVNYRVASRADLPVRAFPDRSLTPDDLSALKDELDRAGWVVDALLGTGLTGPPHAPFDQVIAAINEKSRRVFAVDIPSGLDCDAGAAPVATVRATHTATFVALKPGFLAAEAKPYVGQVEVIDIGVPRKLIEQIAGR